MNEFFTKTYYGLKGWQWVAVVGAAGFIFFRLRSGSSGSDSLSTTGGDQSGDAATEAGSEGFQQGYGQGYAAGNYQGQIAPNPPTPPAGSKNCRPMKDPSGKTHTVCGPGAFQNLMHPGQTPVWRWVEGATHTIYATGKKGKPFLNRPPAVKAHRPAPKATSLKNINQMGTQTPVKQMPIGA